MKTSLILAGFLSGILAFCWQARTIHELRTELTTLRKDLGTLAEAKLDQPTKPGSEAEQDRHDQLEVIKLRLKVREQNEALVESRTRERMANVQTLVRSVLPASAGTGGYKLRPEWRGMEALATNQYAQAMKAMGIATTNEFAWFLSLDRAAKMSLAVGRTADARQFASDMLLFDEKFSQGDPEKSNGDAIYTGHLVLGRLALEEGQMEEAKRHLLAAGKTRGSSVLNSFGPNMSLAQDLLRKGEPETVLQFFDLCRKFWSSDHGKLDEWTKDIQAGRIPNFGANLVY